MLSNTSKLYFPKIVFEKPVSLTPTSAEVKPANLYRLEWTRKENKCNNGMSELSDEYESLLLSLHFAISEGYLKEIRRVSWRAVEEWNATRLIDTSLKHIYLKPVASYIEVAFRLLSDSVYDEETQFYYRGTAKKIIPYVLLYKYWVNQVSNGILFNFSKISELITLSLNSELNDQEAGMINKFLTYINSQLGKDIASGN